MPNEGVDWEVQRDAALSFAIEMHGKQKDKIGQPYVFHLVRVASQFEDPKLQAIALLHDIIEDTLVTDGWLRDMGIADEIVDVVNTLTKNPKEIYRDYILRLRKNDSARRVKIADINDNADAHRLHQVSLRVNQETADRLLNKYANALWYLRSPGEPDIDTE